MATADLQLELSYAESGRDARLEGLSERGKALIRQIEDLARSNSQD
jgi:hypothetical protein